ncbi:hypothetical protein [Aquimarina latercula]|uniref:hypothetical protein n=1 Tax=Aquimarina latercula TaxID=987 RepID=UPI000422BBFD|nr:hypothetical protein [Aquimarina latercula]
MRFLLVFTIISMLLFSSCENESINETGDSVSKIIVNGKSTCPDDYSFEACGRCWIDSGQAVSGGCNSTTDSNDNDDNEDDSDNDTICGDFIYNPGNKACVTYVGNGNAGCLNSDKLFVSVKGVVSNPCNTREAVLDIERNLGINIDDQFVELCGYQGNVPPINPSMTKSDFIIYMKKLFEGISVGGKTGNQYAVDFANLLDTNNDGLLTRNEASQAKGSDPRQVLNLEPIFTINGGLATDDVLAYVGLYLGDGALDKYAGDLPQVVQDNMAKFTRTWQPGINASSKRYNAVSGN